MFENVYFSHCYVYTKKMGDFQDQNFVFRKIPENVRQFLRIGNYRRFQFGNNCRNFRIIPEKCRISGLAHKLLYIIHL